jgi:cold shock CspA family protein
MPVFQGVVKWFNVSIGYGFITSSDDGVELFVHGNSCERGFLVNGERVLFDVSDSVPVKGKNRSRQAVRVRVDVRSGPYDGNDVTHHDRLHVTTPTIVC